MDASADIAPHLVSLHHKLDAVQGVQAYINSDSQMVVEFEGRRIGHWVPDGSRLIGEFACEAVLLSAATADEAYQLTLARLS